MRHSELDPVLCENLEKCDEGGVGGSLQEEEHMLYD